MAPFFSSQADLAAFLRKQRNGREWTLAQAAEAAGVSVTDVTNAENPNATGRTTVRRKLLAAYGYELEKGFSVRPSKAKPKG